MEIKITAKKGAQIPKDLIGLFIEDINYAIDGGLYAEMLENRNFESMEVFGGKDMDYHVKEDGLYAWDVYPEDGSTRLSIVQGSPVSGNAPHYLRAEAAEPGCGFSNRAYDGICMRPERTYHVSFYARSAGYQGRLKIAAVKDKAVLAEAHVEVAEPDAFGWRKWTKYELDLSVAQEVRGAVLAVCLEGQGVMEFDHFSMMPDDAVCGVFRKDLAELLKDLRPGFLRFPGGCIVEGATLANRYQYKDTLGPKEARRYNWNRWALHGNSDENGYHSRYAHYGQTYGIGFYEYFLLCEYLGAKPLPVLGVGMACQYQSHEKVDLDAPEIREYIQDYLDLIEFANGAADTKWGSVRAQMGHEAPFGLEMIGVGNEQWEDGESRFFERYTLFEQEIHKVYPDIRLIGTAGPELDSERFGAAWDFYHAHEDQEDFAYAVDEHYYARPEWFLAHTDYFDHVSRSTKIFFGEYAAHPSGWQPMDTPGSNSLEAALAEASFLTGIERNSDVVVMACYAPLFARIGYTQWDPDLIWFDEREAYRTPSYFVQQMFSENLGDHDIAVEGAQIPCQAGYDQDRGELIIKLVNASAGAQDIELTFDKSWGVTDRPVKETALTGADLSDSNGIGNERVHPKERKIRLEDGRYQVAPFTFAVLRISCNGNPCMESE